MSGVDQGSEWTTLLGGFLVGGAGIGLMNPVIADIAVSVVPDEQAGMATGINDTFRQVGVAVGIAAWGALFLARAEDRLIELAPGTPGRLTRQSTLRIQCRQASHEAAPGHFAARGQAP